MTILLTIFLTIFVLIVMFTYLIVLGANIDKTKEEIDIEDLEQIKYLKNYRDRRTIIWR